jgi:DNA repair protein RadA
MPPKDPFSITNLHGLDDRTRNSLSEAEIYSVKDLVVRGAMNVSEATGIRFDYCNRICSKARTKLEQLGIMNRPFTIDKHKEIERISLGSKTLDGLLGGRGLHVGSITELFGESNSGKTQLCHTLCVTVQLGKHQGGLGGKAIYIDTESTFTQDRIGSIAEAGGSDRGKAVNNIVIARPMSSSEQELYLERVGSIIDQHKNIKLVIIDSVTSLYRAEYIGRAALHERQQRLYRHMQMLRRISEVYGVAVVVTNQVNEAPTDFKGPFPKPIGGHVMAHASTFRIRLRQFGPDRIADLIHSPYLPEKHVYFGISAQGVCDVPTPEPLK